MTKKKKLPYMPFYVDDYEASTAHLTLEADGIYNRLLRLAWRTPGCSLPDDKEWICEHMRSEKWPPIERILKRFWKRSRGRWYNRKQRDIYREIFEERKRKSEGGKISGGRKPLKTKENGVKIPSEKGEDTLNNQNQSQNHLPPNPQGGPFESDLEKKKEQIEFYLKTKKWSSTWGVAPDHEDFALMNPIGAKILAEINGQKSRSSK